MIKVNRRELLLGISAAGLGMTLAPVYANSNSKSRSLKILVLSGSGFIGLHLVADDDINLL